MNSQFVKNRCLPGDKKVYKSTQVIFSGHRLSCFSAGHSEFPPDGFTSAQGALFEGMVLSEILKKRFNTGRLDNLYYFRDNIGNEVDLICDHGVEIDALEIKSGQTIASDFFKGLRCLAKLTDTVRNRSLVYGGNKSFTREDIQVLAWHDLGRHSI